MFKKLILTIITDFLGVNANAGSDGSCLEEKQPAEVKVVLKH